MYIDHYRKDFYDHLLGHRVLLMAGMDMDSVCTVKIMQYLFRLDDNPYTLEVIGGVEQLKQKFNEYRMIRRVVLINCGGTVDLMELFGNPTDVIIFVIDSHRPTHILNIYNESKQIRIVTAPDEGERIPSFDEIFRSDQIDEVDSDDSSDDDEEDDGDDAGPSPGHKRKRGADKRVAALQKQKERREWDNERAKLLFNYTKHNYYGAPASLIALEVAWSKSIGDSEIVWWSIVGLTEYLVLHRMDRPTYTLLVGSLQNHVARVTHDTTASLSILKINFEHELYLFLYRHWNLYASMKHTPPWRCKFRLWSSSGTERLHAYLAEVGFPLKEVKQTFDSMDHHYRRELKTILNRRAEKYDLVDDMSFGSFVANYGYTYQFSALDHYLSALSLLEEPGEKSLSMRFHTALHSLCKTQKSLVMEGIGIAKQIITGMISQVQIFLDLKQLVVTNDLLYAVIQYGTLDAKYFSNPCSLVLLAHHTLQAFISSNPRGRMIQQLPLVLIAPKNPETHYVVGIPPTATDVTQNLFGKAFQQIAKKMPSSLFMDLFETSTCIVKSSEIEKFLEHLLELLA